MATQPVAHYTPEEYLELDRNSEFKHEYIYGEIVPMVGATPWHSLISGNALYEFHIILRPTDVAYSILLSGSC